MKLDINSVLDWLTVSGASWTISDLNGYVHVNLVTTKAAVTLPQELERWLAEQQSWTESGIDSHRVLGRCLSEVVEVRSYHKRLLLRREA
jgi:uncharacterized protein YebE (UPF0316 family)